MTEKKRAMPKITMKEMVEFTNQWKESYIMDAELRGDHSEKYEQDIRMFDAILAALEGPPLEKSWMKLAEELNVPFSAVKIIRDKLYTEMEGPGVKEVLVDELQEDDLIPLTPGGLKSLKNPPAALEGKEKDK